MLPFLMIMTSCYIGQVIQCDRDRERRSEQATVQTPYQIVSFETNEQDKRLSSPYSLRCYARPLGDILREIQQASGITLRIDDKWIAELPTTAYTRSMSIHVLLRRLAELHTLTWRREPIRQQDTSPMVEKAASPNHKGEMASYVLYESAADRRYVQSLQQQSWEPLRQRVRRLRQYVTMSPDQLAELAKQGDYMAAALQQPVTYANAIIAAEVSDAVLNELIDHRNLTLPYDQLPPRAQDALNMIVQADYQQRVEGVASLRQQGNEVPDQPKPPAISTYSVRYSVEGKGSDANLRFAIEYSGGSFSCGLPTVSGGAATSWAEDRFNRARHRIDPMHQAAFRKAPVTLNITTTGWHQFLQSIFERWHLNVFSDAFPDNGPAERLAKPIDFKVLQNIHLEEGLNNCVGLWKRAWWQEGFDGNDFLFLKDDWYQRRDRTEINPLLAQLKQRAGRLTLEDWAAIAALPDTQLERVVTVLGMDSFPFQQNRDVLLFYYSLGSPGRQRLLAHSLSVENLTIQQRDRFIRMVRTVNANFPNEMLPMVSLHLTLTNGQSHLQLRGSDRDGNTILEREWFFSALPQNSNVPRKSPTERTQSR